MDCRRCCQWLSGRPGNAELSGNTGLRGNAELSQTMLSNSRTDDGPPAAVIRKGTNEGSVQGSAGYANTSIVTNEVSGSPSHKPCSELHPTTEKTSWDSSADPLLGRAVKQTEAQASETSATPEHCNTIPINAAVADVTKKPVDRDLPVSTMKLSNDNLTTAEPESSCEGARTEKSHDDDVIVAPTGGTETLIDSDLSASTMKASHDDPIIAEPASSCDGAQIEKSPDDDALVVPPETPQDQPHSTPMQQMHGKVGISGAEDEVTAGTTEVLQNPPHETFKDQAQITTSMNAAETRSSEETDQIEEAEDEHQKKSHDEDLMTAATEGLQNTSQSSSGNQVHSEAGSTGAANSLPEEGDQQLQKGKAKARKQKSNKKWKSKQEAQWGA